jgi:hypothetical protein
MQGRGQGEPPTADLEGVETSKHITSLMQSCTQSAQESSVNLHLLPIVHIVHQNEFDTSGCLPSVKVLSIELFQ